MVIDFKEHFQINSISILKDTAALMNFFQDFQIYLSLCISYMLTEYDEKTPLKPSTSYKCFFQNLFTIKFTEFCKIVLRNKRKKSILTKFIVYHLFGTENRT
ncbi:hypothetical protein ACKWTF_013923 [Chironomus riparius]